MTFPKFNRTDMLLAAVVVLLLAAAVATALAVRFSAPISSYAECVRAGNPVQMSYPSVCVSAHGHRFVNPAEQAPSRPMPL